MAKRQVVSLNTSTPQLVAPQSGDTYQLVRDVFLTTGIMKSEVADGASAVGFVFDTENSFANASAKIASFKNAGTEKAYITNLGMIYATKNIQSADQVVGVYGNFGTVLSGYMQGSGTVTIAGGDYGAATIKVGKDNATGFKGAFRLLGGTQINDGNAMDHCYISPGVCYSAATTNIVGPNLYVSGGTGASASAGNAHGGNVYLRGGTGYGTGHNGYIMMDQIPSSDPGVPGAIYRTAGALMVSI